MGARPTRLRSSYWRPFSYEAFWQQSSCQQLSLQRFSLRQAWAEEALFCRRVELPTRQWQLPASDWSLFCRCFRTSACPASSRAVQFRPALKRPGYIYAELSSWLSCCSPNAFARLGSRLSAPGCMAASTQKLARLLRHCDCCVCRADCSIRRRLVWLPEECRGRRPTQWDRHRCSRRHSSGDSVRHCRLLQGRAGRDRRVSRLQ